MATWPQIFLATGSDTFRLLEYIQSMKKASAQKYGDFAVQSFSYPQTPLSILRSEFFTPAFLSEKRVLFCTGLPWSAVDKISDAEKDSLSKMLDSLDRIPESLVIFFVASTPDKRTKFFKTLSTHAQKIYDFSVWDTEKEKNKYRDWIIATCVSLGSHCSLDGADFLLSYCGFSLDHLYTELQKLCMRRFGEQIQTQDIIDLCIPHEENADFAFANAFATLDLQKICTELSVLFADFSAPEVFNKDILPTLRTVFKAHLTHKTREDFGLHPFVLKKMMPIMKKIPFAVAQQLLEAMKELDIGTKTGKYSLSPDARAFILQIETLFINSIQNAEQPTK